MSILKVVQPQNQQLTVGAQPQSISQAQPQKPLQSPVRQGIMDALGQHPNVVQGSFNPLQGTNFEQQQPQIGVPAWNLPYLADPNPWIGPQQWTNTAGVGYTLAGHYQGAFNTPSPMALPLHQPNYPMYQKLPLMGR